MMVPDRDRQTDRQTRKPRRREPPADECGASTGEPRVGGDRFLAKTKDLVSALWTLFFWTCAKYVTRKNDDDDDDDDDDV